MAEPYEALHTLLARLAALSRSKISQVSVTVSDIGERTQGVRSSFQAIWKSFMQVLTSFQNLKTLTVAWISTTEEFSLEMSQQLIRVLRVKDLEKLYVYIESKGDKRRGVTALDCFRRALPPTLSQMPSLTELDFTFRSKNLRGDGNMLRLLYMPPKEYSSTPGLVKE